MNPKRLSLLAVAALLLTAQSPAPRTGPLPWCDALPLPNPGMPALGVDVAGNVTHIAADLTCRPALVRGPRSTLRLAVAATPAQREHGLMNVPYVPQGQGMLFVFPEGDAPRNFWMKNTITPLDMVFIGANGVVTSVAADVPATKPGTPDSQVATRQGTGAFVIELGGGDAAREAIAKGTRLMIPQVSAE